MLRSKLHCQRGFNLIIFSYKDLEDLLGDVLGNSPVHLALVALHQESHNLFISQDSSGSP